MAVETACLPTERLPARERLGLVACRRESLGFGDERLEPGARFGQHSAHFVPLPARGHRLGESRRQAVGLRAVTDERQERSPFFLDDCELSGQIVALECLDSLAQRITGGDRLGAHTGALGGLFGFTLAAGDGRFGGADGLYEPVLREIRR